MTGAKTVAIPLGNSGFEYRTANDSSKRQRCLRCYIINTKTKEQIYQFKGCGRFSSRSGRSDTPGNIPSYKFLGFDRRYYYLQIKSGTTVEWGQIQPDGAVLRPNRSILTTIAFFPHYTEPKTTVPVETPIIIKEPPNVPKVVVISPTPIKTPIPKEKVSWIQKIINWIIAILNR